MAKSPLLPNGKKMACFQINSLLSEENMTPLSKLTPKEYLIMLMND